MNKEKNIDGTKPKIPSQTHSLLVLQFHGHLTILTNNVLMNLISSLGRRNGRFCRWRCLISSWHNQNKIAEPSRVSESWRVPRNLLGTVYGSFGFSSYRSVLCGCISLSIPIPLSFLSVDTAALFFCTYETAKNVLKDLGPTVWHPAVHMAGAASGEIVCCILSLSSNVIFKTI